tara:strand:+ start:382 stop:1326 length:945 start_codon:yes stop_codon:yes gene_type:complete
MGMWAGIERGWAAYDKRMADKEDREYKRNEQKRLDDQFNENRMLRRLTSISEHIGDRKNPMVIDKVGLDKVKRLLGDIDGANDYLAKLSASPTALKTVLNAIQTRGDNVGTLPTGQELMDNIVIVAENYGDEDWMKAYEEGVSIGQTLLTDPTSVLDDETLASLTSRIGALPTVTRPQVGVEIAPAYLGKIDGEKQRKSFDNSLLAYANNQLSQFPDRNTDEAIKLNDAITNYNDDPTPLRDMFGPIVLDKLKQTGDPLFIPGVSGELDKYVFIPSDVEKLKRASDEERPDLNEQIRDFNTRYGQGAAEYILGR